MKLTRKSYVMLTVAAAMIIGGGVAYAQPAISSPNDETSNVTSTTGPSVTSTTTTAHPTTTASRTASNRPTSAGSAPISPTESPSSSSTTALPPSSTTAPQDPDLAKDVTQVLKAALESTMSVQETKPGSVDEKVSSGKNTIQELFVGEALKQQEENLAAVAEGERAGIVQNLKGSVTITAINNIEDESGEITADADITVASSLSIASQSGALEGDRSSQVNKVAHATFVRDSGVLKVSKLVYQTLVAPEVAESGPPR